VTGDVSMTVTSKRADFHHVPCVLQKSDAVPYTLKIRSGCEGEGMKSSNPHSGIYETDTSRTLDLNGGNPACNQGGIAICEPKGYAMQAFGEYADNDCASCLKSRDYKDATDLVVEPFAVYPQMKAESNCFRNDGKTNCLVNGTNPGFQNAVGVPVALHDPSCAIDASYYKGPGERNGIERNIVAQPVCFENVKYIVRRLTPTECARLQGMPDLWCRLSQIEDMSDEDYEFWKQAHKTYAEVNGKKYKEKTKEQMVKWYNGLQADSSEYKAYGNGMALPCVRVPIHGIAQKGAKTMASLFDGIGGFPLAGLIDGIQTLWTSEIELFPIAVTMERFKEFEKYGCFTFGYEYIDLDHDKNMVEIKEKEKKQMELKMNEYQLPEKISFNFEELKSELTEKVSHYETLVYTDDQIKEAKADKANLNKLKKVLNDERIRLEKEYMVPFNKFKAEINEIISIIDKPVAVIDKQVKEYEEKQKQEKKEAIKALWNEQDVPDGLTLEAIWDERFLNVSFNMTHVKQVFTDAIDKFNRDIATLSNLPEFGFEAVEVYKTTLDVNKAISEAKRMSEIAKAKAEREAFEQKRLAAEAEAKKQEAFPADAMNPPVEEKVAKPVEPEKQWIGFKALLSVEDATALKEFFESRQIEFKAI